jgi:hypothetical protein
MGHMISYQCKKCEIIRIEHVGVGMLGVGSELCACYHCHRYVLKKLKWNRNFEEAILKCPYCRKTIEAIDHGDSCPICASPIDAEPIGLWD